MMVALCKTSVRKRGHWESLTASKGCMLASALASHETKRVHWTRNATSDVILFSLLLF